ncbi:hypothetical protein [Bradyrhizobium sp. 144]|uniref:hypothetical protein n=1 Tax=Bradyrhizobium sp. 144 TaxID=2782620 RepID=UPI001FF7B7E1|nr:hypothetical protein [Bradyrhizobium sp. 144]MCK1695084.1 hypothetical protein [Bradyrhizobium sp. 144]
MTAPGQCVKSTEKALATRAVPHMGQGQLVCTVLFKAEALPGKQAGQHRLVAFNAMPEKKALAIASSVRSFSLRRSSKSQSRCGFSTERPSPPVAKAAVRFLERLHPPDRARDPDPENIRARLLLRKAILNDGRDGPNAKNFSMRHPFRPPPGLKDESRFAPPWESLRFSTTPTRLKRTAQGARNVRTRPGDRE